MNIFSSLELLLLVGAVIANLALVVVVLENRLRSATSIVYAVLGIVVSAWLLVIYIASHQVDSLSHLFWARLSIFLAAPMSLSFFVLAQTLPYSRLQMSRKLLWIFSVATFVVMLINVSSLAFTEVVISDEGRPGVVTGPGIIPFGVLSTFFSFGAVYVLFRRFLRSTGEERHQFKLVMSGIFIMLGLIIATIFLPVVLFNDHSFVIFSPVYVLTFLSLTAYAIVKHRLFDVKVITTEALTVVLWVALLAKVFASGSSSERVTDGFVFIISLIFGVLLIKSVRREVEQRIQLEKLTKELKGANEKLRELDRIKSQFLSFASHQVKSPMSVVKGYASLIADGTYGEVSGKIKETAEKIMRSADTLIALVNNLLDLRKLEEGRVEYNFEVVGLGELVSEVVEELRPLAKNKKLDLNFESLVRDTKVKIDKQKFTQVIANLVDNAIKYTEKGRVDVHVDFEEGCKDRAVVEVSDTGYGMKKELLPQLFTQFTRGKGDTKYIRGTGLGLYIAKQFVQAHKGEITADSPGEGKGSVFRVTVPVV